MSEGRTARPCGRLLRLVTGIVLVVEGGRHLIGTSGNLVLSTLGVTLALLAVYALIHLVIARCLSGLNPWLGALIAVTPVALVFLLSDAPGRLGSLLFVGTSLLATAARNDAGCEVMTLPGMVFGKRTHLVCLAFSPIDWAEDAIARKKEARAQ